MTNTMQPTIGKTRRSRAAGFTFIGLLLVVTMAGIALMVVSQVWQTMQKRDKEEELLFIGDQMRRALTLYSANAVGGQRYPRSLEDLLTDPRLPVPRHYLRKIFVDPMTGRPEWGLVKAGDFVTGVYSLSEEEPIKKAGFSLADRAFEGKTKYSEWIFVPRTGRALPGIPPGGIPAATPQLQPGTAPSTPGK